MLIDIPGYFIDIPTNFGLLFFGMWISSMYVHVLSALIVMMPVFLI